MVAHTTPLDPWHLAPGRHLAHLHANQYQPSKDCHVTAHPLEVAAAAPRIAFHRAQRRD